MGSWGEQFSTGDQGDQRRVFYEASCRTCPSCQSKEISMVRDVAGCRHNGDGYGTEVFTCKNCNWCTSFQYDESGDSYFYEMSYAKYITPNKPKVYQTLTAEDRKGYEKMRRHAPEEAVRSMMLVKGYDPAVISQFLLSLAATPPPVEVPIPPRSWDEALRAKYKRILKLIPEDKAVYNMKQEGLSDQDIEQFLKTVKEQQALEPQSPPQPQPQSRPQSNGTGSSRRNSENEPQPSPREGGSWRCFRNKTSPDPKAPRPAWR